MYLTAVKENEKFGLITIALCKVFLMAEQQLPIHSIRNYLEATQYVPCKYYRGSYDATKCIKA